MTQYVIIVPNSLLSKEIAPMNMHANIPHIYVETRSLTASITETMLTMFANSPTQTCHVAMPYTPLSWIDDITIKKIIDIKMFSELMINSALDKLLIKSFVDLKYFWDKLLTFIYIVNYRFLKSIPFYYFCIFQLNIPHTFNETIVAKANSILIELLISSIFQLANDNCVHHKANKKPSPKR